MKAANERDDDRERHRLKHLALDSREGEEWHVDRDDDDLSKYRGLDHLLARKQRFVQALGLGKQPSKLVLSIGKATQGVLGDDHRPVDNEPEVQRAKAHEVRRDTGFQHPGGRQQHRDRDDERCDHCRPEIAQEQEQHRNHK